jgi:hypothetical protein
MIRIKYRLNFKNIQEVKVTPLEAGELRYYWETF